MYLVIIGIMGVVGGIWGAINEHPVAVIAVIPFLFIFFTGLGVVFSGKDLEQP